MSSKSTASKPKLELPRDVAEDGYPAGDGPKWISLALGRKDYFTGATRYLSDDGEETALVLEFADDTEQVFRPARLVTTRRLAEVLGALGVPVPYYGLHDIAKIGQAIGRVADRAQEEEQASAAIDICLLTGAFVEDCLANCDSFVLVGRAGRDVRAAIEHVRANSADGLVHRAPVILEPERSALLVWAVPLTAHLRNRLGTLADSTLGLSLRRNGLHRERLAARPAPGTTKGPEMSAWVVPNGWRGISAEMPDGNGETGPLEPEPLGTVGKPYTHARGRAYARAPYERCPTPNANHDFEEGLDEGEDG